MLSYKQDYMLERENNIYEINLEDSTVKLAYRYRKRNTEVEYGIEKSSGRLYCVEIGKNSIVRIFLN